MKNYKTLLKLRSQSGLRGNERISVCVRVKNEAGELPRFIASLKKQKMFESVHLIFLDSGSSDGTIEILKNISCDLYTIHSSEFSFGDSCNLMMSLSSSELNVFFSGHVILEEDYFFQKIFNLFEQIGEFSAYFRQIVNEYLGYSIYDSTFLKYYFPKFNGQSPILLKNGFHFSNAASVISRKQWKEIGFEDVIASEDQIFAEEVSLKFGGVYYFPDLNVKHSHNESPESITKRVKINVLAKHPNGVPIYKYYLSFFKLFLSLFINSFAFKDSLKFAKAHSEGYIIK
ncbi:MAG: glycosyltransferase [Sphingobacteriaceae bacterium]|nr:glycosyltransferase [Sphingobacteriaceae bacterium]